MSTDRIDSTIKLLQSTNEDILTLGEVNEEVISEAESALGLKFPSDYKYFVRKFGALCFEAEEFYGIKRDGLEAKSIPCAVFATLTARDRDDIDQCMIKIKSSGYGPVFSLDVSQQGENGLCPVVETELSFKSTRDKKQVEESFSEFFHNELSRAVDEL